MLYSNKKQYVNRHSTVNLYRTRPEPRDLDTYKEGPGEAG
jgi:hypothetical protein